MKNQCALSKWLKNPNALNMGLEAHCIWRDRYVWKKQFNLNVQRVSKFHQHVIGLGSKKSMLKRVVKNPSALSMRLNALVYEELLFEGSNLT